MAVSSYKTNASENTSISGINIAEGCPPSGINNAIRQMMADVKTKFDSVDSAVNTAQDTADAALPKDGGTVTGDIVLGRNLKTNTDTSSVALYGDTGATTTGPAVIMYGKARTSDAGVVKIRAGNGTNASNLVMRPDGTITWNGTTIALTGDFLSSGGGTMTGTLFINKANGTTETTGDSYISLGNSTAEGTTGNSHGTLRLYADTTAYGNVRVKSDLPGNRAYYIGDGSTSTAARYYHIPVGGISTTAEGVAGVGSTTSPIYMDADGVLKACGTSLTDYLPLSGGTMTASITTTSIAPIKKSTDNSYIYIDGATDNTKGACLFLTGKDQTTHHGNFILRANNGTDSTDLKGTPAGALTWGGSTVLTTATTGNAAINAATATTASSCTGNAATATKLGTATKGGATQPIYINSGFPTACTLFSGTGTAGIAKIGYASILNATSSETAGDQSGYFQIGNLLICYGFKKKGSGSGTISFPRAFTTVASIVATPGHGANTDTDTGGYGNCVGISDVTTSKFRYSASSDDSINWVAIGYHS